jgi:hypothetical protein
VCPHAAVERTLPADEITGNSLRCFVACAYGALDVVRVVHLSGHVDEFSGPVAAAAVLAEHPNHTLTTAWSPSGCASKKLVIVAPDSELKHGRIYFLIPSDTLPADRRTKQQISSNSKKSAKRSSSGDTTRQDNYLRKLITKTPSSQGRSYIVARCTNGNFKMVGRKSMAASFLLVCTPLCSGPIHLSAPASSGHEHRRRPNSTRVGVWRPQVESIVEEASD